MCPSASFATGVVGFSYENQCPSLLPEATTPESCTRHKHLAFLGLPELLVSVLESHREEGKRTVRHLQGILKWSRLDFYTNENGLCAPLGFKPNTHFS